MSRKNKHYSNEEQLNLLCRYHESGMSKVGFCRLHSISSTSVLDYWQKKHETPKKVLPLQTEPDDEDMANRSKDDYKKEIAELRKRNHELEKALEFSRLETLARDMMIDKAEEYFDIAIRKKSGAK